MSELPIIASAADTALEPEAFAPGAVIEGDPRMMSRDLYVSPDERVFTGIWSVKPGKYHDLMESEETIVKGYRIEMPSPASAQTAGGS